MENTVRFAFAAAAETGTQLVVFCQWQRARHLAGLLIVPSTQWTVAVGFKPRVTLDQSFRAGNVSTVNGDTSGGPGQMWSCGRIREDHDCAFKRKYLVGRAMSNADRMLFRNHATRGSP